MLLRVPLVPGENDEPADLEGIASFAASLGGNLRAHILPYHDAGRGKYALRNLSYRMGDAGAPTPEAVARAASAFARAGLAVTIGG